MAHHNPPRYGANTKCRQAKRSNQWEKKSNILIFSLLQPHP